MILTASFFGDGVCIFRKRERESRKNVQSNKIRWEILRNLDDEDDFLLIIQKFTYRHTTNVHISGGKIRNNFRYVRENDRRVTHNISKE